MFHSQLSTTWNELLIEQYALFGKHLLLFSILLMHPRKVLIAKFYHTHKNKVVYTVLLYIHIHIDIRTTKVLIIIVSRFRTLKILD